jgi:hypothetical protein
MNHKEIIEQHRQTLSSHTQVAYHNDGPTQSQFRLSQA